MAIEDGKRKEFDWDIQKKKGPHNVPLGDENHVPPWLTPLLRARFFGHCTVHAESNKNECNLYCLDCTGDAICSSCLPHHTDHRIVQIRRSSYHNVIKASEISDLIDISGVQTYVINSAKILFLDERPQARPVKGVTYACQTCCRPLLESYRFCSIGCKSRGMNQDQKITIALSGQHQRSEGLRWSESDQISRSSKRSVDAVHAEECVRVSSDVRNKGNSPESMFPRRQPPPVKKEGDTPPSNVLSESQNNIKIRRRKLKTNKEKLQSYLCIFSSVNF